jgi:hypothetical protein
LLIFCIFTMNAQTYERFDVLRAVVIKFCALGCKAVCCVERSSVCCLFHAESCLASCSSLETGATYSCEKSVDFQWLHVVISFRGEVWLLRERRLQKSQLSSCRIF